MPPPVTPAGPRCVRITSPNIRLLLSAQSLLSCLGGGIKPHYNTISAPEQNSSSPVSSVRICSSINSITEVTSLLWCFLMFALHNQSDPESSLVLCLQARRCPGFRSKWPLVVVSKVTSCWSEYMNMSEYVTTASPQTIIAQFPSARGHLTPRRASGTGHL